MMGERQARQCQPYRPYASIARLRLSAKSLHTLTCLFAVKGSLGVRTIGDLRLVGAPGGQRQDETEAEKYRITDQLTSLFWVLTR